MIATIAGKELRTLFASPLAWVVLTVMQLVVGYAFLRRLDDFLQLQPQLAQIRCGCFGLLQWLQTLRPGALSFQCVRRLRPRVLECLRFGLGIVVSLQ